MSLGSEKNNVFYMCTGLKVTKIIVIFGNNE